MDNILLYLRTTFLLFILWWSFRLLVYFTFLWIMLQWTNIHLRFWFVFLQICAQKYYPSSDRHTTYLLFNKADQRHVIHMSLWDRIVYSHSSYLDGIDYVARKVGKSLGKMWMYVFICTMWIRSELFGVLLFKWDRRKTFLKSMYLALYCSVLTTV